MPNGERKARSRAPLVAVGVIGIMLLLAGCSPAQVSFTFGDGSNATGPIRVESAGRVLLDIPKGSYVRGIVD